MEDWLVMAFTCTYLAIRLAVLIRPTGPAAPLAAASNAEGGLPQGWEAPFLTDRSPIFSAKRLWFSTFYLTWPTAIIESQ